MKLLRLVIVASVAFLLGAVPSLAWSRLDDFRGAKIQVLQTVSDSLHQDGWSNLARERLISSINGTWIALTNLDLDGDVDLAKVCQEKPIRMRKIDDYSFSMEIEGQLPNKEKIVFRNEYINRRGLSYAIRMDFRSRFNILGPDAPADQRAVLQEAAAEYANLDAVLLLLSPDVLLEVGGQGGFPQLYGRCE